jgi:UDP-N-acetyl-D-glucosamine dehydrogenase
LEDGSGKTAGIDFHLAYSPEREDPSNPDSKVERIPKLVGGLTPACRDKAAAIYSHAIHTIVPVDSCKVAEAAKLLENIFRSVNIALVNELKVIYGSMGVDIWEVIAAAKTKPFGFMPFYPGPGLGGHCIPIDPFYLTWKAREYGLNTRFIELAGEINTAMPQHVVEVCMRESPTYVLIEKLEALGATVAYNDPHIPVIRATREHPHLAGRTSSPIEDNYDLILLATNHADYHSYDFSSFQCPIVDTRNCITNKPKRHYKA